MRHMRCVAQDNRALVQGLAHQRQIALRKIAHAAVQQFGGFRGRAFGKISRFQQQGFVAALRCIERNAHARSAAAHHNCVPICIQFV